MKTIYKNNCAFNGYSYRATGDKEWVNIQVRKSGNVSWETIETVDSAYFDYSARSFDIYNPYNQNPAHMIQIISAIHGEEDNSYDNN